jgi:hypothetical protein
MSELVDGVSKYIVKPLLQLFCCCAKKALNNFLPIRPCFLISRWRLARHKSCVIIIIFNIDNFVSSLFHNWRMVAESFQCPLHIRLYDKPCTVSNLTGIIHRFSIDYSSHQSCWSDVSRLRGWRNEASTCWPNGHSYCRHPGRRNQSCRPQC